MPLQQTSGNDTADAYGGGKAVVPNYIEDVFSTYLYTGNGSTQTITNGIDLAGKGGLVWTKSRTEEGRSHAWFDTVRGINSFISSNLTSNYTVSPSGDAIASFNTTGYTLGADTGNWGVNNTGAGNLVSWTFRKQPKFFDVVTYTGTGSVQTIAHSLGSVPGSIIVKRTDAASNWPVYHRSLANTSYLKLNDYFTTVTGSSIWNSTTATSTVFSVGTDAMVNASGGTYVAYVYAHNAGGFGLTGTDNVITCDTFTTDGSGIASINLGYEPQWLLVKDLGSSQYFQLADNMRGLGTSTSTQYSLFAGAAQAETGSNVFTINATGFGITQYASRSYIYIAIRRGPMKVPTDATKVYTSSATTNATGATITTNFPVDLAFDRPKAAGYNWQWQDRLRGSPLLQSNATSAEFSPSPLLFTFDSNTSIKTNGFLDGEGAAHAWSFRRAPGFFDEVCYTGNGTSNTAIAHNLTALPELWIVKARNQGTRNWQVYYNLSSSSYARLILNTTDAGTTGIAYNAGTNLYAQPTSTNLYLMNGFPNTSAETYVSYLFATCPGVSKVGSYTGTGATQTIACGFTGGARFVLVKRTDSTGDWYVWDTARGMVSGTDPSLLLNSTAAEVNANSVYTATTGFQIVSTAAGINASGGTYIFLAIA
jgi:hypothetical protein